jgi:uncharacterized surface protein with fasciclin (FAS1) repeats
MRKLFIIMLAFVASTTAFSQEKSIVGIAAGSADHTTLVAALQAADLVTTLEGKGPFTVFAPTNAAFDKLPAGTVTDLLKPENKAQLAKILTYHVVSGNLDAAAVTEAIKSGKGKAVLTTVSGGKLTATLEKGKVKITSDSDNTSYVITTDLKGSNGVIHVIDSVLLPK